MGQIRHSLSQTKVLLKSLGTAPGPWWDCRQWYLKEFSTVTWSDWSNFFSFFSGGSLIKTVLSSLKSSHVKLSGNRFEISQCFHILVHQFPAISTLCLPFEGKLQQRCHLFYLPPSRLGWTVSREGATRQTSVLLKEVMTVCYEEQRIVWKWCGERNSLAGTLTLQRR